MCVFVCLCVCVCEREREREVGEKELSTKPDLNSYVKFLSKGRGDGVVNRRGGEIS